ncbi:MAG: prephenate dehydratase [Deltaproteobacteria bacterium]
MKKRDRINALRKKIDAIDTELLKALNKRAGHVVEIGRIKLEKNKEVYSPEREREIYKRLTLLNKGPLPNAAIRHIFREVMSASISLEKPLKIAFFGPFATFTHEAAIKHFGLSCGFVPKSYIADVFDIVERGEADFGVVPVENTAEGAVSHTLDMFITSNLKICAEVMIEVSMALLNKSGRVEDVRKVASHPHALAQCGKWLKAHLRNVATMDAASTASAAQLAKEDPSVAAIASEASAALYDLRVIEKKIEDNPHHMTRFLVVGKKDYKKTGSDKTSVMFAIKDSPGALYKMLKPFSTRNVNLTKVESRPIKTKAWEYIFFLDMDGHVTDKKIKDALKELTDMCLFIKVLGSYPKSQKI